MKKSVMMAVAAELRPTEQSMANAPYTHPWLDLRWNAIWGQSSLLVTSDRITRQWQCRKPERAGVRMSRDVSRGFHSICSLTGGPGEVHADDNERAP